MRKLIGLVILLILLWSGGVFFVNRTVNSTLETLRSEGWDISADQSMARSFGLMGTQLSNLKAISNLGWWFIQTEKLTTGLRTIAPTTLRTIISGQTTIDLAEKNTIQITKGMISTDLRIGLRQNVPIRMLGVVSDAISIEGDTLLTGWEELEFKVLEVLDGDYLVIGNWQEIGLVPDLHFQLDPVGNVLPETITAIALEGAVKFNGVIALNDPSPRYLTKFTLQEMAVIWGNISLIAAGELTINDRGIPEGLMTITVQNASLLITLMMDAGMLPPENQSIFDMMMQPDGSLSLPIRFRDGQMSMGFIPLGPSPVFR